MPRLLILLLLFPAPLMAQDAAPWNPDGNGDGCITTADLILLLGVFSLCPDPPTVDCPETSFTCSDTLDFLGYSYPTIPIGDQCWFAENLRTQAYSNGDAIPSNLDDGAWEATLEGATTVYGTDGSSCESTSAKAPAPTWTPATRRNPQPPLDGFTTGTRWMMPGDSAPPGGMCRQAQTGQSWRASSPDRASSAMWAQH